MGGPFVDEDGAMLIVKGDDEKEVREKIKNDLWMKHGVLKLESVKRWQIFIDVRRVGNVRDTGSAREKISGSHGSQSRANVTSCDSLDQLSVF